MIEVPPSQSICMHDERPPVGGVMVESGGADAPKSGKRRECREARASRRGLGGGSSGVSSRAQAEGHNPQREGEEAGSGERSRLRRRGRRASGADEGRSLRRAALERRRRRVLWFSWFFAVARGVGAVILFFCAALRSGTKKVLGAVFTWAFFLARSEGSPSFLGACTKKLREPSGRVLRGRYWAA
jgi:hypothetical protein